MTQKASGDAVKDALRQLESLYVNISFPQRSKIQKESSTGETTLTKPESAMARRNRTNDNVS